MSVIFFLMSIGFMSPVDIKKRPCRPVEFKGQWPPSGGWVGGAEKEARHQSMRIEVVRSGPLLSSLE